MRLWFNLLCQDIEAQLQFYQALLQLPEAPGTRSAIYRAVETEHFQLGLNAPEAYALLGLADRQLGATLPSPRSVTGYATYYGQWQAVLADPEDNVFRVSAVGVPRNVA